MDFVRRNHKKCLIIILVIAAFLRLWRLDDVPVSLFGDELDVGYHAYSILETGRDYSGNFMPIHFQSLAEWRTPLYLYSVVPTVAIFGISAWGVRLPAAIFGILGVWGMYLLIKEMVNGQWLMSKDKSKSGISHQSLAIIASFVLAVSPWHIQYSRAAFEVTQLLAFYIFGLYFFFKSLREGKWLWMSVALFVSTPLIYSSAKLFTPILMFFLLIVWRKEIFATKSKDIKKAIAAGLIIGIPTAYATLFAGGAQRFGYISVFTDPTRETEVGVKRQLAAEFRGEEGLGLQPTIVDKLFYNKFTFWWEIINENYLQPFSSEFLFIKGDLNLRHSIEDIGQFYKIEFVAMLLGLVLFFTRFKDRRIKLFIAFWIFAGVVPSAITREGGRHATRLILILPPLVFLISYGIFKVTNLERKWIRILLSGAYTFFFVVNFIFYQNNYWRENPWYSERWWHAGYKEAIQSIKAIDREYEKVVITMQNEPAWIFFAGWYEYSPARWQEVKPDKNWVMLEGYGRITNIDKFYFGSPAGESMYDWGEVIDDETLYLASEKEVGINLVLEPERAPEDLELIKSITYPSGEPAFYLFAGK